MLCKDTLRFEKKKDLGLLALIMPITLFNCDIWSLECGLRLKFNLFLLFSVFKGVYPKFSVLTCEECKSY